MAPILFASVAASRTRVTPEDAAASATPARRSRTTRLPTVLRTATAVITSQKQQATVKTLHPSMHILGGGQALALSHRQRIYRMLERPRSSKVAFALFLLLLVCIFLSILLYFLSTISDDVRRSPVILTLEIFCTAVFTLELVARVYVGTLDPFRMLCDVTLLVDLTSVLPFYIERGLEGLGYSQLLEASEYTLQVISILQLLRLLRVFKLLRHYSGWRVLMIAVERSWRAMAVPAFAMAMTIIVLSGLLHAIESVHIIHIRDSHEADLKLLPFRDSDARTSNITSLQDLYSHIYKISADEELADQSALGNGFETMWAVFWLVMTLGYDGSLGTGNGYSQVVIALALVSGLVFTTMPITIIGGAFSSAWEQKEVVEVAMRVQELLLEAGHTANDVRLVFDAFDNDGNHSLDWDEFKRALRVLQINLPITKMRSLFTLFDADDSKTVDVEEFCRILFPSKVAHDVLHDTQGTLSTKDTVFRDSRSDSETSVADPEAAKRAFTARAESRKSMRGMDGSNKAMAKAVSQSFATGGLSWHEWRKSAQTLISPMLVTQDKDAPPKPPATGDSPENAAEELIAAARREAAVSRGLRSWQRKSQTYAPAAEPPAFKPPAVRGGRLPSIASTSASAPMLEEMSQRLEKVEAGMARVIALLEAQQQVPPGSSSRG